MSMSEYFAILCLLCTAPTASAIWAVPRRMVLIDIVCFTAQKSKISSSSG